MDVYEWVMKQARGYRQEAIAMKPADREDREIKQQYLEIASVLYTVGAQLEMTEEINPSKK